MIAGQSIQNIAIADIAIGKRVGFFDAAHAETLAISLAADGQRDPIHLRRNGNAAKQPWTLIAGRHRLAAAVQLGWSEIAAIQVADEHADDKACRKLELSENLDHRKPRPLERALFIAARRDIEEKQVHPDHVGERSQDRAIRIRHATEKTKLSTSITMTDVADWRASTAASVGCSLPTFERYIRLYDKLILPWLDTDSDGRPLPHARLPDFAEALNAHVLGERLSNLTRIAAFPEARAREKLIRIIVADPELATLDAAIVAAELGLSTGTRPSKYAHATASVLNGWSRLTIYEQRSFAEQFAGNLTREIAQIMVKKFQEKRML